MKVSFATLTSFVTLQDLKINILSSRCVNGGENRRQILFGRLERTANHPAKEGGHIARYHFCTPCGHLMTPTLRLNVVSRYNGLTLT